MLQSVLYRVNQSENSGWTNVEPSADRVVAAPDGGHALTVDVPVAAAVFDVPVEVAAAECVGVAEALSSPLPQAMTRPTMAMIANRQTSAKGRLRKSCIRFPPCVRTVFNRSVSERAPQAV
jgi:hypothetical protein